jgi:hypothetical protein
MRISRTRIFCAVIGIIAAIAAIAGCVVLVNDNDKDTREFTLQGIVESTECINYINLATETKMTILWSNENKTFTGLPIGCEYPATSLNITFCCENLLGESVWFRTDDDGEIIEVSVYNTYSTNYHIMGAIVLFMVGVGGCFVSITSVMHRNQYKEIQ